MRFFSSDANRSGDEIALLAPDAVHISRYGHDLVFMRGKIVKIDIFFLHDAVDFIHFANSSYLDISIIHFFSVLCKRCR